MTVLKNDVLKVWCACSTFSKNNSTKIKIQQKAVYKNINGGTEN